MGIKLRQSTNGKELTGTASGQVAVWNNTTKEWDIGSIFDNLPKLLNWGCLTLGVAATPTLCPYSKELVSTAANTNKWIVADKAGQLTFAAVRQRLVHAQDITFTLALDFVPTAFSIVLPAGQTFASAVLPALAVPAGTLMTVDAVEATAAAVAHSMDFTSYLEF